MAVVRKGLYLLFLFATILDQKLASFLDGNDTNAFGDVDKLKEILGSNFEVLKDTSGQIIGFEAIEPKSSKSASHLEKDGKMPTKTIEKVAKKIPASKDDGSICCST